ncbi:hypothetical protein [Chryseobacterium sp. MP_3.2]|uniref:hypothetical protein n=1 Tax=Chryseobacterium sp. MP_3.2 TaxID=3071712 RepID=UPI002E05C7D1|nr:putative nucleic-acid-binding Zn-ribbon protein [Chryseobacterium sp. MP_3.2]
MESTIKQNRLKSFIAGFLWKPAPKPEPETVESLGKLLNPNYNHEIWRTCNSCGHQWDAIIDGYSICPKCRSTDLRSGKQL